MFADQVKKEYDSDDEDEQKKVEVVEETKNSFGFQFVLQEVQLVLECFLCLGQKRVFLS